MEAVGVVLCHLHGFQLFQACLLGYLILALVGIVFEMSHVGDVAHIAHLVADVLEVAEQEVEGDGGTGVAQMCIAINGGAANVHAHAARNDGAKQLFTAT